MRVAVCPSDRTAVGWYRLGLPISTLMAQDVGMEFEMLPGLPLNVDENGKPVGLTDDFEPDVLVMQRPTQQWQLAALLDARRRHIPVVVELDDDLRSLPRRLAFAKGFEPEHLQVLVECCRNADLLTVSTQALADRYCADGHYLVLPNYVPEAWLEIGVYPNIGPTAASVTAGLPVVGWTGTVGNHVGDLEVTCGGVAAAIREHGDGALRARFRVIGRTEQVRAALRLDGEPQHVAWQAMDRYPHEIAKFDIGITPLAENPFNHAKSWLKPLEMAACGVPVVMSPVTEYSKLSSYGIGVLAHGWHTDWKKQVSWLLNDATARHELVDRGRQAVREHLTIEDNAWRWAEAWASVASRLEA